MCWLLNIRLWLAFFLILVLALPAQADGPGPYKIYLPVIGAGCDMTTLATLQISDGEVTVDLLRGRIHLADWNPTIPQLKAGGVWQDSALATGRRMVDRRFGNVSDALSLVVSSPNQNDTIGEAGDLMHLLEKARDYTASGWQTDPVWIKRQAGCETNPTYALVFDYKIPNLSNPYAAPFAAATKLATLNDFSLSLEHSIWLSNPPGVGTCVQASGEQIEDEAMSTWVSVQADATMDVSQMIQTTTGRIIEVADAGAGGSLWKSDDDGATWQNVATSPGVMSQAIIQISTGRILIGDVGNIYKSDDDGDTWQLLSALPAGAVRSFIQLSSGRILAGENGQILYSDDDSATWGVLTTVPMQYVYALLQTSTGRILAGDEGQIWKSDNNGATWAIATTLPSSNIFAFLQTESGRILAGGAELWGSTNNGATWSLMMPLSAFAGGAASLLQLADGRLFMGDLGKIWLSDDDGLTWTTETTLPTLSVSALLQAVSGAVFAGELGVIWEYSGEITLTATVGRSATCNDELFVANKSNVANLTNIYINDGGVWTSNLFPFTFPGHTHLLPAVPAIGDAVYFGINTTYINSGPFESLVFDLQDIIIYDTSYTIVWEYYNGAAWTALTVTDGTNPGTGAFRTPGVSSVHWAAPGNWTTRALNLDGGPAVTGYWVRARVSALVGAITPPSQQNRNIYTIVLPYANIAAAQVPGDIPALAEIKLHNRSDKDGRAGSGPDLWDNRLMVGLRSYDRGPSFSAYLNASDEQNPVGVTVAAGTDTAIGAGISAITGQLATYSPAAAQAYADRITFTLGPTIARDYYGSFHAFLRAGVTSGSSGDIWAQLQVRTGSGGVTLTSAADYLKGTTNYEVLDLGRVSIPASGLLSFNDLGDSTVLAIQMKNVPAAARTVYIHDLILLPVDEVALDAVDYANIAASVVGRQSGTPHLVDFDSLTYQKVDVRSIVRTADGNGFVSSIYVPSGGPAFLQANARQRLWVLAMQTDDVGADPIWLAPPWIAHSIQVFANSRWLGLRGDR